MRRSVQVKLLLLVGVALNGHAEIHFDDVSRSAGISGGGTTWGASWGDFNSDGWPDIWVGNHDMMPSLYLNQTDGTFVDIAAAAWSGDPRWDKHGAAWADFDRDGDQDLVLVSDAAYVNGKLVETLGDDHLFLNQQGHLTDVAKSRGISLHQSSRVPLWIDVNNDGRLDLLIVARRNDQSGSVVYEQTPQGFRPIQVGLKERRTRKREYYLALLDNVLKLHFRYPEDVFVTDHQESAQLADLTGDGVLDLVFFSQPLRVYATKTMPFEDVTYELGFPALSDVADAAIGDFDGDGSNDLFVTTGRYILSDIVQNAPTAVEATIYGRDESDDMSTVKGIDFSTDGVATFEFSPEWLDRLQIRIGKRGLVPESKTFSLAASDESAWGPVPDAAVSPGTVSVSFDTEQHVWRIRNALTFQFVDVIVNSTTAIQNTAPHNFERFTPKGSVLLLLGRKDGLERSDTAIGVPSATNCMSVAAGDFDNDMDLDVYAVCTGPIKNSPNLLFENDGKGKFTLVPHAGGAEGSALGRGDSVVVADYDRDGFLDLFVTNGSDPSSPFVANGPHQLFRNKGNNNHWIEIDLAGRTSNAAGIGARVEVRTGDVVQFREQSGGMHRSSQNNSRLHFGLGAHDTIDSVTVYWPSGTVQRLDHVPANAILKIDETD